MKHFVQIILLAIVIPADYIHGACLIKFCLSTETDSDRFENENSVEKRNRTLSREISVNLQNKKIESYIKYLNTHTESVNWTLETATKNDPYVNVRYIGIKNSKDPRPISWQHWEIEGKAAGLSTLILRKFVDNKQYEEETINVIVTNE